MTILELREDIVKNKLKHFYIFVGEEIGVINIYLAEMSNKISLPITRTDCVARIYSEMGDNLFGQTNNFYVIRDDKEFAKDGAFDTIEQDVGDNYVVMLYDKIDSRLRMGKVLKDNIVNFEKLSPTFLENMVMKELCLRGDRAAKLVGLCDDCYDLILSEMDKIKQYSESKNIDYTESMDTLLHNGMICTKEDVTVFNFAEAVMCRKINIAFHNASILYNNGIDAITALGTLYATMKNVLLVQICEDDDIPGTTGIDSKQVYFAKKNVDHYSAETLVYGLKLIARVIDGIKSGTIDNTYAIPYVISSLC